MDGLSTLTEFAPQVALVAVFSFMVVRLLETQNAATTEMHSRHAGTVTELLTRCSESQKQMQSAFQAFLDAHISQSDKFITLQAANMERFLTLLGDDVKANSRDIRELTKSMNDKGRL